MDEMKEKMDDVVEDGKKLVNEVLEDQYEATHKEHTFSVFDTWYEMVAVIFAVIYVTFKTYMFVSKGGYEGGIENVIEFLLSVVISLFGVFCFCAIVEVQEKLDIMSDNIDLMAGYMHDYYLDIEDDLTVIGKFDHVNYVQETKKQGGKGNYNKKNNYRKNNNNNNKGNAGKPETEASGSKE